MSDRIIYDVSQHLFNWFWLIPGILGLVIGLRWLRLTQTAPPNWRSTNVARRRASFLCAVSLVWMVLTYAVFIYPFLRYTLMLMRGTYQTLNGPVRHFGGWMTEFESGGQFTIGDVAFPYHCTMFPSIITIPMDCFADPNVEVLRTGLIKTDRAVRAFYVIEATGKPTILRLEYEGLP
jgi:hypothetical protein